MVSIWCSWSTASPCFEWVMLTVSCRFSPSGNGYCGWHGSPSSGHTVGVQGWLLRTLQTMPPCCAAAIVHMAVHAHAALPIMAAYRASGVTSASPLLFGVGRDLDLDHLVRVLDRLALLDLVDHVHAGRDLADHGVLAVQARGLAIHNEELAVGRIVVAALARHADDAALERHVGELGRQVRIFGAAGAVEVLPVAGLRHEAGDHAMERHAVVEFLARQRLD